MILVSFSSGEDALFNDVKTMTLLARKVLKIRRSAFLGGHPDRYRDTCMQKHSFILLERYIDKLENCTVEQYQYLLENSNSE